MVKTAPIIDFANVMVGRTFSWGACDCNTVALQFLDFYAGSYPAVPGYTSITKDILNKYNSKSRAYKFYKNFSVTWDEYLSDFCDLNPVTPLFQIGDLILCPMENGITGVHICLGTKSLSVDPIKGVILIPTLDLLVLKDISIYRIRR